MKQLYPLLAASLLFGTGVPATKAAVQVSVDFFHDHLDSYGDWREVGGYGYCWQPRDAGRDWRPYSDGRWLYTDAGWTWDSEEPYSWAVYHYGRWARVDRVGWVWVPGTEWGPAWVSWRRGPHHVGWAPLPPEATFSHSAGFSGRVDADYDIGPANYSFVNVRDFGAPRLQTVILRPRENITIIHQTTNITRVSYTNNVVRNEGPEYDVISHESALPIRRLKLDRHEQVEGDPGNWRAEQLRTRVDGESLRVAAPSFSEAPASAPRKVAAKVGNAEVDRGWKNAGPPAEVAKFRSKMKSDPAGPADGVAPTKAARRADAPPPQRAPGRPTLFDEPAQPVKPVGANSPAAAPAEPIPGRPAKAGKTAKAGKPAELAVEQRPAAPAETIEQPKARKGTNKATEARPVPTSASQPAPMPRGYPKSEPAAADRHPVPVSVAPPQQPKVHAEKAAVRAKPAPAAAPRVEHAIPNAPEPHPAVKRPAANPQPAAARPVAPAKPVAAKGKAKGKPDDKKDQIQ